MSDSAPLTRLIDGIVHEQNQQILICRPIRYKDTTLRTAPPHCNHLSIQWLELQAIV